MFRSPDPRNEWNTSLKEFESKDRSEEMLPLCNEYHRQHNIECREDTRPLANEIPHIDYKNYLSTLILLNEQTGERMSVKQWLLVIETEISELKAKRRLIDDQSQKSKKSHNSIEFEKDIEERSILIQRINPINEELRPLKNHFCDHEDSEMCFENLEELIYYRQNQIIFRFSEFCFQLEIVSLPFGDIKGATVGDCICMELELVLLGLERSNAQNFSLFMGGLRISFEISHFI